MLIYYNGDSNTIGSELELGQCWTDFVSKHYCAESINDAEGGCSNDHIFRSTYTYLNKCKLNNKFPDLIIIGWTEWWRQEWRRQGRYETALYAKTKILNSPYEKPLTEIGRAHV